MKQFLREIAEIYSRQHAHELHEICFVFPGKRAGRFFERYLQDNLASSSSHDTAVMLPRITTISELAEQLCGKVVDNRIDMLFVLYNEYCRLQPTGASIPDFDRFRSWGDTIISDFNDVDMYLADAEKLFKNLSDYKEIQTDYLTEEQKKILEQYFGATFAEGHAERFWVHFQPENSSKQTKKKFLRIWETMYPLYRAFNARLDAEGLCYPGAAFKQSLKKLRECNDIPKLLQCQRIVFVGFNVLSTVEFAIFAELRDTLHADGSRFADFYWDCTGPALKDEQNSATKFISVNRKAFPSMYQLIESNTETFPTDINVIGCPSNSIQAKVTHDLLLKLYDNTRDKKHVRTAIILPDESLMMPMIYALPENIEACNITMGYPLKITSIASFMALLRRMQARRRVSKGVTNFFYDDVASVLQHPISTLLFPPNVVSDFIAKAIEDRMFLIPTTELAKAFSEYSVLFDAADNPAILQQCEGKMHYPTTAYILLLMQNICSRLIQEDIKKTGNILVQQKLDYDNAQAYIQAVNQLDDTLYRRGIETSMNQIFKLTDRLLASETVTLQGEPLQGLQLMGMLETRGIDFENVIIPSMNEKIFPRKSNKRTFIPNTLRIGYGLATSFFEESIFAYNFYRLISRAKSVYLLYDTRAGGMRSGDVSRYILQLQCLYGLDSSRIRQISFSPIDTGISTLAIPKTGKVRELLNKYLSGDINDKHTKKLSASALKNYLKCPLMFYFGNLRGMKSDDKLDEFISPIDQGNIFHQVMESIYKRMPSPDMKNEQGDTLIAKESISGWLKHHKAKIIDIIDDVIREYTKNQYQPGGKNLSREDLNIYYDKLKQFVFSSLEADQKLAEAHGHIIYRGSEVQDVHQYELPNGYKVNMTYIIDRLDELGAENPHLRISDYKTGKDNHEIKKIENVFKEKDDMAVFQLMLYANLYAKKHNHAGPIRLDLYCTRDMHVRDHDTAVSCNGMPLDDYRNFNDQFIEILNGTLNELFGLDAPDDSPEYKYFLPDSTKKHCKYCDFKSICEQAH